MKRFRWIFQCFRGSFRRFEVERSVFRQNARETNPNQNNYLKFFVLTMNTHNIRLNFSGGGVQYWQEIQMEGLAMRIILDTDKKTITVPWNYTDKLAAMNRTIKEAMGDDAKELDFKQYLDDCWKYAMEHSDTQLKTAQKPVKPEKKG